MVKVLFWTENFFPDIGGIEVLASHLIHELQQRGHEFCMITSTANRRGIQDDHDEFEFTIHRFPFRNAISNHNLKQTKEILGSLAEIIHSFQPDLIHLNTQVISLFFLDLFFKNNPTLSIPLLYSIHSPLQFMGSSSTHWVAQHSIFLRLLNQSKWVIAVSQSILEDIITLLPEISDRTSLILNGLPIPNLQPSPLPFSPPKLLCLGRICFEKGFDTAIMAFTKLLGEVPTARLVLAGNGPALVDLSQQIEVLGIQASVDRLGWVPPEDVPALINTCTAVIVPSRWKEPFGLVALQASQMARPVIASRIGGLSEVVLDQVTGILVEPDCPDALATAILNILQHPQQSCEMGYAGQLRSQQYFSMERCVNQHDQVYRSVVAGSSC